jgi:hypothetical protein
MALTYAEQLDAESKTHGKRKKVLGEESGPAAERSIGANLLTGLLGMPADMLLGLLAPGQMKPAPGDAPLTSDWLRKQAIDRGWMDAPPERTGAEELGQFASNFTPVGKALAGIKAGLLGLGAIKGVGRGVEAVRGLTKAAEAAPEARSLLDAGSTGAGAAPSAQGPVSGLIDIPQSRLIMPTALSTDAIQRYGQQTVRNPKRNMFPGVYGDPREMVREAASRVDPESPYLRYLFDVGREDIANIGQHGTRQGNIYTAASGDLPYKTAAKPKGSDAAKDVMTPANAQRMQDIIGETMKVPKLYDPMANWYVMDPAYRKIVDLFGEDAAPEIYARFNTITGMASPSSDVMKEWNRGTGAHWLANEGRFQDFKRYGGLGGLGPEDMWDISGHPHHSTAHAGPMQKYLRGGVIDMGSAKVPSYVPASGVPETGFQTRHAVGDAHFARAIGLGDTRGTASGKSASVPEMVDIGDWWRQNVTDPLKIEAVPGQGVAWGSVSGATGVDSPIGAGKLELLAMSMGKRAEREGIDAKYVRDAVLQGLTHSGYVTPELSALIGAGSGGGLLANWLMQQKKKTDDEEFYQPMQ